MKNLNKISLALLFISASFSYKAMASSVKDANEIDNLGRTKIYKLAVQFNSTKWSTIVKEYKELLPFCTKEVINKVVKDTESDKKDEGKTTLEVSTLEVLSKQEEPVMNENILYDAINLLIKYGATVSKRAIDNATKVLNERINDKQQLAIVNLLKNEYEKQEKQENEKQEMSKKFKSDRQKKLYDLKINTRN